MLQKNKMDKVELEFEFSLNSPEVKAEADQVKKSITGVGDTAEAQAKRVEANMKKILNSPASQSQFNLQTKLEDAKNASFTEKNTGKLVEYNRTIERTEAEINRLKNAGKTGFDELGNAVGKSTNAAGKAFSGLRLIANILPGIGLAGLIGFISTPILQYVANLNIFKDKLDQIIETRNQLQKVELKGAQNATAELTTLKIQQAAITSSNVPLSERKEIYKQMQKDYPAYFANISFENAAAGKTKKAYDELTGAILATAKARAYSDRITENTNRDLENENKAKNLDTEVLKLEIKKRALGERAAEQAKNSTKDGAGLSSVLRADELQGQINDLKKQKANLKTDSELLAKQNEELENRAIEQIGKGGKIKGSVGSDVKIPATSDSSKSILTAEENLQQRIQAIKDKFARKALDKNEEAKQAILDEFKVLVNEIEKQATVYDDFVKKYGKSKADGLGLKRPSSETLQPIREAAISDLTYRQDTAKLAIKLNDDKKLYEDFEAYKTALGEEKAKERFAGQLNTEQTYLQKLQADYAIFYAQGVAGGFTAPVQERINIVQKQIDEEKKAEQKKQDDLLKSLVSYSEERKVITEKYNKDLITVGDNKAGADELKKNYKLKLDALDDAHIKELSSYKALFAGIENLSEQQAKKVVNDVRIMLKAAVAAGTISADLAKSITDKLRQTDKAIVSILPDKLIKIANHLDGIAGNVSAINSEFGNLISTLANVLGQFANIKKFSAEFAKEGATSEEKFAAGANLVAVGVGAATSLVGMFINAAKERKRAEDEYYASVIKHQNDYNLSLNEEIRLRTELSDNLFVKDLKGRIVDGTAALVDANAKYLKSIEELNGGKAKLGQRNAVDAKTLIGGAGSGAILGAAIGSVVPVIGTAIGAIVGGIAGFIGGLFGGKKKKDIFGSLLQEYPELLQKATDGTVKFNEALAKSLIANNLVDDKTKALLENTLALAEARKAALEQINSVITDLAGNLGTDLRNTLVNAFKEGEDSALAFGKTVGGVLENIVSQMLFAAVFGDSFDQLEKEMKASYDIGGDGSFVDDITRFFSEAGPNIDAFNRGLQAAKDEAAKNGINIFGSNNSDPKTSNSLTGAIRKELTEEGASILTGVTRNSNEVAKQNLAVSKEHSILLKENTTTISDGLELIREQHLEQLEIIATNTGNTVLKLEDTLKVLSDIKENTAPKLIPR